MSHQHNSLQAVFDFLNKLELAKITFRLERIREDTIMVRVDVRGERWEVEFYANGKVEIERFISSIEGVVSGEDSEVLIHELFKNQSV